MKKKSGSLSKAMGMLPPRNLPAAIIVVIQYSGCLRGCDTKTLFCRQFGNIHFDSLSCCLYLCTV